MEAVVGVVGGLSGNELTATLGEGDHDGSSVLFSGFHAGVDGVGSDNVDSWDGKSVLLGVVKKVIEGLPVTTPGLTEAGSLEKACSVIADE